MAQDFNVGSEDIIRLLQEIAQSVSAIGDLNQSLTAYLEEQKNKDQKTAEAAQINPQAVAAAGNATDAAIAGAAFATSYAGNVSEQLTSPIKEVPSPTTQVPGIDAGLQTGQTPPTPVNNISQQVIAFNGGIGQMMQSAAYSAPISNSSLQSGSPGGAGAIPTSAGAVSGGMTQAQLTQYEEQQQQAALDTQATTALTRETENPTITGPLSTSGPIANLFSGLIPSLTGGARAAGPNAPVKLPASVGALGRGGIAGLVGGSIFGVLNSAKDLFYGELDASRNMMPVRQAGYQVSGASEGGQNIQIGDVFSENTLGAPWLTALTGGNNLKAPGMSSDFKTGSEIYAQALKDSLLSGGLLTEQQTTDAIQEGATRGFTNSGKSTNGSGLFDQFYKMETTVMKGTYGALDSSTIGNYGESMFKQFGQSLAQSTKDLLNFNSAASAAQKGLVQYTQEVLIATQSFQQGGITSGTEARTLAQEYSSLPNVLSPVLQSFVSAAAPAMLALEPGATSPLGVASMAAGYTTTMAGENPYQTPLTAIAAAKKEIAILEKGIKKGTPEDRQMLAIQRYANMFGLQAGDVTKIISDQNIASLTSAATLYNLDNLDTTNYGKMKGTPAVAKLREYISAYNASHKLSAKGIKAENTIISDLSSGKGKEGIKTLADAIDALKQRTGQSQQSQQTPVIGVITIKAEPGTKITSSRTGSGTGGTNSRNGSSATLPVRSS